MPYSISQISISIIGDWGCRRLSKGWNVGGSFFSPNKQPLPLSAVISSFTGLRRSKRIWRQILWSLSSLMFPTWRQRPKLMCSDVDGAMEGIQCRFFGSAAWSVWLLITLVCRGKCSKSPAACPQCQDELLPKWGQTPLATTPTTPFMPSHQSKYLKNDSDKDNKNHATNIKKQSTNNCWLHCY